MYRTRRALLLALPPLLFGCRELRLPSASEYPPPTDGTPPTNSAAAGPLRDPAASIGFLIGAASEARHLAGDPAHAATVAREFNLLSSLDALRMDVLRPSPQAFEFQPMDDLVGFAEARAMGVRGHALVSHTDLPGWISQGSYTRDEWIEILREHIQTTVGRYRGRVQMWDVVKEVYNRDGTLRPSVWLQGIGPDYIELAFRFANAADPGARLFLSDLDGAARDKRWNAIYDLVARLKRQGVPIAGVAMQLHVDITEGVMWRKVQQHMDRFAGVGLEVQVAAVDVGVASFPGTDRERLSKQATHYRRLLRGCLSAQRCTAFVTWGVHDGYSWRAPDTPLLFDRNWQAKPAYTAVREVLQGDESDPDNDGSVNPPPPPPPPPDSVQPPPDSVTPPPPGLRDLARARGIRIGAASDAWWIMNDTMHAKTLAREFDVVTTECSLKMGCFRGASRDTWDFQWADYVVDFAERNDMEVRGHTLVWHGFNPAWVEQGSYTRDEWIEILREHIQTTVGRYRGRIKYWDVVNEAVDWDGTMRQTVWMRNIGPEYIELAFQFAHQADPDALLFYNEMDGSSRTAMWNTVYTLVTDLMARGVPIHGVGMQMHMYAQWPPDPTAFVSNITRFGDLGLQVHITEADVTIDGFPGTREQKLQRQASIYGDMLRSCLTARGCSAFITWGVHDGYSWRAAGEPLLFGTDWQPKPAYDTLRDLLAAQ